jgi:hypothetical protein
MVKIVLQLTGRHRFNLFLFLTCSLLSLPLGTISETPLAGQENIVRFKNNFFSATSDSALLFWARGGQSRPAGSTDVHSSGWR